MLANPCFFSFVCVFFGHLIGKIVFKQSEMGLKFETLTHIQRGVETEWGVLNDFIRTTVSQFYH